MAEEDVRDFLTALSAAGVKHIVVGANALAAYGYVRATEDLDVLVEPNRANAERLAVAIKDFAGVSLQFFQVSIEIMSRPSAGFFMGVEPDRIDVFTKIAGLNFERVWRDRVLANIDGVDVHVPSLDSMIAAKRASIKVRAPGSHKALQDQSDLRWLLDERERRRRLERRR